MRNACRPMGRFFCLLKWFAAAVAMAATVTAQTTGPVMTQVADVVYRADGSTARGTVLISWPAFTTPDGKAVAAGSLNVQLGSGGAFLASLTPNTGAQPAGVFYKVVYQLTNQEPSTEYWVVPATISTTIGAVRAKLQPPTIAAQTLTRDVAEANYVHVAGDQTLGGVKTFVASPGVPTPQNPGDAANKGYVDAANANSMASPAPIGSMTPNTGSFSNLTTQTLLSDSNATNDVNFIAQSLFKTPVAFNRTLPTNNAPMGWVDSALTIQQAVVPPGNTWKLCPNGGLISGGYQFNIPLQVGAFNCDNSATAASTEPMALIAGNLTLTPAANRQVMSVAEFNSLSHVPYSLAWDTTGAVQGSEFFNWGGLFTNISDGKGGIGVYVKSNFWNSGTPNYDSWSVGKAFQTGSTLKPTVANGFYYQVTTPMALPTVGYTGSSEPTWCTSDGCKVSDGSIVWTGHPKSGEGAWQIAYRAQDWLGTGLDIVNNVPYSSGFGIMMRSPDNSYPLNIAFSRGNPGGIGNIKWVFGVNAAPYTDWFDLYSATDGINRWTIKPGGESRFTSAGSSAVDVNMDGNSGTGGFKVGNGTADFSGTWIDGFGNMTLDTPETGQTAQVTLKDHGATKWIGFGKSTNNDLNIGYDAITGKTRMRFPAPVSGNSNTYISAEGNGTIYLGLDQGTGGVVFGNGAASSSASVNSAGDFTVRNLTVNGTCTGCGSGGNGGDLASPPAIGSVTPNAGTFTGLRANDSATTSYPVVDVRAWGAIGDGKFIPDNCSMVAGSSVVTCPGSSANPPIVATGPPFVTSDVGKMFWMPAAGNVGPNNYIVATITSYISASKVTLSANALNTVARSSATFGHDNYAVLCAVSNCTSATVPNNWIAWPRNGKQIHVPAGMYLTSHPLYVRNGDMWWGDGETASDIRLMNAASDIFVLCGDGNASAGVDTCTGDQFNAGASQTFTVKGLFLTNSTMNDDTVHGPVGVYVPPDAAAYKIVDNWFDTSSGGIFVNRGNGGTIDNNLCDFAVKLFCFAMDGGTTTDGGGSGGEYESNNFATQIINLQSYGQATSVWLHGVNDVEVRGLQSLFGTSRDLAIGTIIGRGSQAVESSRRINIHDSAFQRSWTQSPGNPATTIIDINEDCVGCIIAHNTFANGYKYDITVPQQTPLINVDGLLIEGNQFKDSQQYNAGSSPGYSSIYLANVGNRGQITIANNHWENIGNYAVWSSQNVNLLGNTCHNPMQRSAPAGESAAQKVCWYLSDGAVNSVARDNVTDSSSYGAVGIATAGGHGATLDSSGNRSGWATCDVCVADVAGETVRSVNERASNDGASGAGAFLSSASAGALNTQNGFQVGGTTVVDAARNATVNNLTVSGTCNGCGMSSNGYGYLVSKYASIQAAIDAAYNNGTVQGKVIDDRTSAYSGAGFYVPDSVTVELAPVPYIFTGTVTHNNGNNNVTAAIVVEQGAHVAGRSTSSNHGTVIGVAAGFAGDIIATTSEGTGIGSSALWWHWGSIENLNIVGTGQTSGRCLVVENMGETARVENIEARSCYGNNIEIIGASATQSSIRNITTMRSQTASGIRFTNLAGVGKVDGLSGDCNPTALVSVQENAAGSLTILGLKAEGEASICTGNVQDPVVLLDGVGGFNDHVRVIGGYAFGTSQANFAKFINGGNAILETEGLYITGYTNMLNDTVRGVTVPLSSSMSKQPFYYEPGGTTYANQAFTLTGGTFVQGQPATTPTEIFGLTTGSATLLAAAGNGDNSSVLTGGIQISGQNRTTYGTPPEIMARWGYRWLGAGLGYDTTNFDLVPAWNSGDTSSRNLGNALSVCKKGSTTVSCRWPNIYALNVDTTTLTLNGSAVTIPTAGSTMPAMNGTGSAGSSGNFARADHVHPSDTSRVGTASITAYGACGDGTHVCQVTTNSQGLVTNETAVAITGGATNIPYWSNNVAAGTSVALSGSANKVYCYGIRIDQPINVTYVGIFVGTGDSTGNYSVQIFPPGSNQLPVFSSTAVHVSAAAGAEQQFSQTGNATWAATPGIYQLCTTGTAVTATMKGSASPMWNYYSQPGGLSSSGGLIGGTLTSAVAPTFATVAPTVVLH